MGNEMKHLKNNEYDQVKYRKEKEHVSELMIYKERKGTD